MGSTCNCYVTQKSEPNEFKVVAKQSSSADDIIKMEKNLDDVQPLDDRDYQLTRSAKEKKQLPKIIMKNGGSYEGEWYKGMRHGYGKHIWSD